MPVSCPGKQAIFVQLCYTVNSVETNLSVCKKRILRKYSLNRMREEPGIKKKNKDKWLVFIHLCNGIACIPGNGTISSLSTLTP